MKSEVASLEWLAGGLNSLADHVAHIPPEQLKSTLGVLSAIAEAAARRPEQERDWFGFELRTGRVLAHYLPNMFALMERPDIEAEPGFEWVGDWRLSSMLASEDRTVVVLWERTMRRRDLKPESAEPAKEPTP